MKEFKIEYAYLIKSDQGYYCHESHLLSSIKEMAARVFSRRKARMLAGQINGQVEQENMMPAVLRAIIEEKLRGSFTASFARNVLNDISGIPDGSYDCTVVPTLGGRYTEDLRKLLFTGACRYADIYHTAHSLIMSYYNLMSSMECYEYDPELDGRGVEELEITMQIGEMFEQQIHSLAILEQDAREYLWTAFLASNPKAAGQFYIMLDTFSEKIIKEYEADPEKCFQQYMDLASKYL